MNDKELDKYLREVRQTVENPQALRQKLSSRPRKSKSAKDVKVERVSAQDLMNL